MTQPEPPPDSMAKLEFTFRVRSYHHNAVWEEQKHFTWFMSVLLSAQLIVTTTDKIGRSEKAVLVVIAAVVGTVLALTAFRVQRREGSYFRNANVVYVEAFNKVFQETPIPPPPAQTNKGLLQLIVSFAVGRAGVRDYFQILFLSFALVFVGLATYALVAL